MTTSASLYLLHTPNQLPADPSSLDEGTVFPLLRRVGDGSTGQLGWAFAVPKPPTTGTIAERRKNRLTCSVLRALGFLYDTNTPGDGKYNYFYLKDESLINWCSTGLFDPATLPDLDGVDPFTVRPPRDGAQSLVLTGNGRFAIDVKALFAVDQFKFQGDLGEFNLGVSGRETSPSFSSINCQLTDSMKVSFPSGFFPTLTFEQDGVAGRLKCNGKFVVPNNNEAVPVGPGLETVTIASDNRHDRLITGVATLVSEMPSDSSDLVKPSLAIEVFPSFTFQPKDELPISVSLGHHGVSLRLRPTEVKNEGDEPEPIGSPEVKVNHLKPCVRITVRGPSIHAEASSSGALEALRLLEPAERKFENAVEQLNDFMTYSFDVCLPPTRVPDLTFAELLRLEALSFELPDLLSAPKLDDLTGFIQRLEFGLSLPKVNISANPIEIDLRRFNLTFADLSAQLSLPEPINYDLWKDILRFRGLDGVLLPPVTITSLVLLDGLVLKVVFARIPVDALTLEFHLPSQVNIDLFELGFPDLGLPALNEFELPFTKIDEFNFQVRLPTGLSAPAVPKLWSVSLKRPGNIRIGLHVTAVDVGELYVKFTFAEKVPTLEINLERFVLKWSFGFSLPDLSIPKLTLDTPLPTVRLPRIDQDFDLRFLKLRVIKAGVDICSFGILNLDATFKTLTLDIPNLGTIEEPKYPALKLFNADITLELSLDLSLSLAKCFLSDLLGDLPSVDFRLSIPRLGKIPDFDNFDISALIPRFSISEIVASFGSLLTPIIPFELAVRIPNPKLPKVRWDELRLVIGFKLDLSTFTLGENRIYFFLPTLRGASDNAPRQALECDIFTLTFPNRPEPLGFPKEDNHDGYFDLNSHTFVVELKYKKDDTPEPPPKVKAYFPGGMDPRAARLGREAVENLADDTKVKDTSPANLPEITGLELKREYSKRFELEFDSLDPKFWPEAGPEQLSFRLSPKGLTLAANLGKTEVLVDDSGFGSDGSSDNKNNGLIKPFKFQPQDKLRELKSRIVIIDNELKEAGVYAKTEVPGVDGMMAEVSVALRQTKKGALPEVIASLELERSDETPLAEFSIKLLELSLERIQLGLIWRMEEREWDYSIIADGTIGFTGAAELVPDLEDLRVPSIQVVGLDLRRLNLRELRVPIDLVKPVRFDILDGMFGVELGDLEIGWTFEGGIPKPRLLACELAKLEFKNPGALEVSITVGGLNIEFDPDLSAHVKLPSSLGIEVALGPTVRFAGRVGWVETETERYLFASGKVMLQGFPEIQGLLKFGTGLKNSGRREINLVLFGEMEGLDEQLFSGVVVKSLGLGIGLNNRLSVIPPRPSADQVIARIDQLAPGEVEGWEFVREGGFYMSIVGAVTLASNVGEPDVLNAYVARLVVSIDTNFDIVAAGKMWLSCTVDGVKSHPNNPAFVGALVLSPSQQKMEVVLESRKNAFVEQNDLIKKLLDKGKVRFAFRMTPELVDFHLSEFSYADQMFGVQMEFRGEYRFAIFKRAVLLKSELGATGTISRSLSAGPGGFEMDGQAFLRVGYGGLLSDRGIMAYAFIDAGIRFRVSAWIEIGFSISFKICGKRYSRSWTIVFRTRVPELELTFRGAIAAADFGRLVSVDVQVGINIVICGYSLRASGRLAVNPELYQEVRARVSAYEEELNQAVKRLEAGQSGNLKNLLALESHKSLSTRNLTDHTSNAWEIGQKLPNVEKWLLYKRDSAFTLLPTCDSTWLTPTIASVDELVLDKVDEKIVASFKVNSPTNPIADQKKNIRLIGLRGQTDQGEKVPTILINRSWPVISAAEKDGSITVNLDITTSGVTVPTKMTYRLFGGIWSVEESVAGLQAEDHDTVHYLNDVERVVFPVGTWIEIESFANDIITTKVDHGIDESCRIVLRPAKGVVFDRGDVRRFEEEDKLKCSVTFRVTTMASKRELKLNDFKGWPEDIGDWQLAPAIEIAPTWNARNRLAALREGRISNEEYRSYTGAAAGWAETANLDDGTRTIRQSTAGYTVAFDERFGSADPRYTVPEAHSFPGVLSTRFRPINEVAIVGADEVLTAARFYEQKAKEVGRQELHGALDLIDDEAKMQSQAQAANLLLHRFSDPAGIRDDDHPEAPFSDVRINADDSERRARVVYGWLIAASDQDIKYIEDNRQMFVRRSGGSATAVDELRIPSPKATSVPETLPIRQEFIIDESNPGLEKARVSIKLPIRVPEEVLKSMPEEIGRFQIYRRIGSNPEVLIGENLRPDVSYLHDSDVVVQRPVLFSDDFQVVNRQFVDQVPQSLKSDDSFPMVTYRLQAIAEDDPGSAKENRESYTSISWPQPVPIFIPPVIEVPPNLAIAVSVESLINGSTFEFQFVDMSGENPVLAQQAGRPIRGEEFQLCLDDENLKQNGFYIGEADDELSRRDPDGSTLTLDGVRMSEQLESEIGKIIVDINPREADGEHDPFTLVEDKMVIGKSYRLFVRSKSDKVAKSLRRINVLIVRELPTYWDATVRFQVKETLERIPEQHVQNVLAADAEPVLVDFSADDLYSAGRSAIRAVWPSFTLMEGGIELQFRDFDDSSMRSRAMIEVVEADRYSISKQDFRNEDFWIARPADRLEHYASRIVTSEAPASNKEFFKNIFLWKRDGAVVDRLKWLDDAKKTLLELKTDSSWKDVAQVVRSVQECLLAFEKSPLNLNLLGTRRKIELIRHGLRSLIVGNIFAVDWSDDAKNETELIRIRSENQRLLALLVNIEQGRPEPLTNPDAEAGTFLDRDTSRKLAGIVRRRLAIADEYLGLAKVDDARTFKSLSNGDLLPRQQAWERTRDDAMSLATEHDEISALPVTQDITNLVSNNNWLAKQGFVADGINKLIVAMNETELARFVPRAAGLTQLLKELEKAVAEGDEDTLAAILKRPHHELTTTKNEAGETIPKPLPLRAFLPPDVRRAKPGELPPLPDENLERLGLRVGQLATLNSNGVISVWTTRGSSVDTEPMRRIQNFEVGIGATHVELAETSNRPLVLVGFEEEERVELWDAASAVPRRSLPSRVRGRFAQTARGQEILTVEDGIAKLNSIESPERAPQLFKSFIGEEFEPIDGLVAYHDEAGVLGATIGTNMLFWRDLGRPENKTPMKKIDLGASAISMQVLTLPMGPQFVVATTTTVCLVDPMEGKVIFSETVEEEIKALIVDRRELKAYVRIGDGSIVKVFDLVLPKSERAQVPELKLAELKQFSIRPGKGLSVLYGRHDGDDLSYVVTPIDGDSVDLYNLKEILGNNTTASQQLPISLELGATTGDVLDVSSALLTARSARAGADIMHLFHLWERLGFALDIAAQDKTTRLLPFNELRKVIRDAIKEMPRRGETNILKTIINLQEHYIYVIEGEEPDAEFRSEDRVGFSHAKVAVVPEAFLKTAISVTCEVTFNGAGFDSKTNTLGVLEARLEPPTGLRTLTLSQDIADSKNGEYKVVFNEGVLRGRSFQATKIDGHFQLSIPDDTSLPKDKLERSSVTVLLEGPEVTCTLAKDGDQYKLTLQQAIAVGDNIEFKVVFLEGAVKGKAFVAARVSNSELRIESKELPDELTTKVQVVAGKGVKAAYHLEQWLTHRSIDVAQDEVSKFIELAHVAHLSRLVGVPAADRLGTVVSPKQDSMIDNGTIRVQPRTERFVKVPASAGISHWRWMLPDRKGHRMMAAARRVSRYEPLLRWWLNLHTRFDLPEEQAYGAKEFKIKSQDDVKGYVQIDRSLVSAAKWQPLLVNLTDGPGKGQSRRVLRIEKAGLGDRLFIDPQDPWSPKPVDGQTKCNVVDTEMQELRATEFAIREVNPSNATEAYVRIDGTLPATTGWQPLRIELTDGNGAGQQREIIEVNGNKLSIDPEDPWLTPPTVGQKCRVIDAAFGWRLVVIDPIHDPVVGEGPQSLMVYQYPHSRWPRFSYQIPLDGMRSTYNQISRVRTGYDGVELAFRYFLPDRIDKDDAADLGQLLKGITISNESGLSLPNRTTKNVPIGAETQVRLFRHERMLNLPELPFFYRYRLDVRSAYKSRLLEHDRKTTSDLLPDDDNLSPPAQRLPSCLGMNTLTMRTMPSVEAMLADEQPVDNDKVKLRFASGSDALDVDNLILKVRPTIHDAWTELEVASCDESGLVTLKAALDEKPQAGWKSALAFRGGFEATFYVSTNRDHLTREEAASEPHAIVYPNSKLFSVDLSDAGSLDDLSGPDVPEWLKQVFADNETSVLDSAQIAVVLADCEWEITDSSLTYVLRKENGELDVYWDTTGYPARDLPDFAMEYQLFALSIPGSGPLPSQSDIFTAAGSIQMPWSPNYLPVESPKMPVVSVSSGLFLGRVNESGQVEIQDRNLTVPLERVIINGIPYWRLRFWIFNERGQEILKLDEREQTVNLFVQGQRDGRSTRGINAKLLEHLN